MRFGCDVSAPTRGHGGGMTTRTFIVSVLVCACGPMPAGSEVDAGLAVDAGMMSAADAGSNGGADAGMAACSGTGACSSLSAMQCQFGLALGCAPVRTSSCGQRGLCTSASAQQNVGACRAAGACRWDAGCSFDPTCPSNQSQQACLAASCAWTEQITSCTGTWRCSALLADGGTQATCDAFSNATGFACR